MQQASIRRMALWFYLPALAWLLLLTLFPLVFSLGVSMTDYRLGVPVCFVGLRHYLKLFQAPAFYRALGVTLLITGIATFGEVFLGTALALFLAQKRPGFAFIRLCVFLPIMLSPLVTGFFFRYLFDWLGPIGYLTHWRWFTHPTLALITILVADFWQWTPFVVLLCTAGLASIPLEIEEAARLDRAGWWLRFREILFPHLRFPILLALLFRALDTVKMLDLPYILTGGGPGDSTVTLSLLTYRYGFFFHQVGRAAALSWLLVLLTNLLTTLFLLLLAKQKGGTIKKQKGLDRS